MEGMDEDDEVPLQFRMAGSSSPGNADPVMASDSELEAMGITVMRPNG